MDILVRLSVPNYIYKFYQTAAQCVAGCSTEDIMADALSAYAVLLSQDISDKREMDFPEEMRKNKK